MKSKIVHFLLGASLITLQAAGQQNRAQKLLSTRAATKEGRSDTAFLPKLVTRDVVYEVAAEKGGTVHIDNNKRNLDIRLWAEPKVKIVTTISIDEKKGSLDTEQMMKEAGLSLRSFGNRVELDFLNKLERFPDQERFENFEDMFRQGQNRTLYQKNSKSPAPTTAESELLEILGTQSQTYWSATGRSNITMTVFIPEDSKLDIDNKNTDIIINGNIGTASFKLTRSNLDARNFKKLSVIAEYYHINISDVDDAELELVQGTFTAGVIAILDLDSQGSEIEYESGVSIYMRSKQDRITIDQISRVNGRKLYGELRIGRLINQLDIEGIGADIKIRNITSMTEKIRLVNQYADLRLPVRNLTDYAVGFYGKNSTVFAPFEKTPVPPSKEDEKNEKPEDPKLTGKTVPSTGNDEEWGSFFNKLSNYNSLGGQKGPSKFTASVGNVSGKHTKFEIECHQCSVDFK
jgi:hypothetical protein